MPDPVTAVRLCCRTPVEAHHSWDCPATPIFAETMEAVRPQGFDLILWSLTSLPLYVISRPRLALDIDPEYASWTISDRCCELHGAID